MLESQANNYACKIAKVMGYDENKQAVIAYGLIAIMQMATIAAIITIFGLIFHIVLECFIIFIGVGLLRKSTGGAHAQTMYGCLIMSCFSICIMALLSKYAFVHLLVVPSTILTLAAFIFAFILIYKFAPVDSPNKPIKSTDKIKRLRKQSFITILIYFIINLILVILSFKSFNIISVVHSFNCVVMWQSFTLTKPGSLFINKIDSKFRVL